MKSFARTAGTLSKLLLLFVLSTIIALSPVEQPLVDALAVDTVRTDTPTVLDGEVWDVVQVGDKIVVAGDFTKVRRQSSSVIYNQANLFAYDINTGEIDEDFFPNVNGEIRDIEVASDGFYIAGKFTQIDGQWRERVAKFTPQLNLSGWKVYGTSAAVTTIATDGNWVYYGGQFESVGGNPNLKYIARANSQSAAVDTGFKFTWGQSIGATYMSGGSVKRTNGVSKLDLTPNGKLFVSHRHLTVNGHNLAGLFQWNNGLVTNYSAKDTNGNQLYSQSVCGGRIYPRDLEVSPDGSYFVVVHQGGDNGFACDTAVKFSTSGDGQAVWISRAFDSIFSVGIEDDAVYIGGHFRYLVHPDAPSAFPNPNIKPYNASAANNKFKTQMIDPGYVVARQQIGALNPNTGKAILSWDPGSNTQIGVFGITVIDRGLLIGQHNNNGTWDVVAGENTGRSAFFDNGDDTPPVDEPAICEVTILADGGMEFEWLEQPGALAYNLRKNDKWLATVTDETDYIDESGLKADEYELRVRVKGANLDFDCEVTNPDQDQDVTLFSCSTTYLPGNGTRYDWADVGHDNYILRKNDKWIATVTNGLTYTDSTSNGGDEYVMRTRAQGVITDHVCELTNPEDVDNQNDFVCTLAIVNGNAVLSWNDNGSPSFNIRKNDGWIATATGLSYTDTNYQNGDEYEIVTQADGTKFYHDCAL